MTLPFRSLMAGGALLALAGCGLTGDLQRPPPLFGEPTERQEGALPDRTVGEGLSTVDLDSEAEEEDSDDQPDAEEELMGGPGG